MRKLITSGLGALALLGASAAMAGTVEVRPIQSGTPLAQAGTCNVNAGRCEETFGSGTTFQIVVVGLDQPETTGLTLGMRFSLADGTGSAHWTAADNSSLAPTSGGGFTGVVATPDPGTFLSPISQISACDHPAECLISNLAPTAGTLPSGTVYGMVLGFTTSCSTLTCTFLVDIDDDGGDFSWSGTGGAIVNTYTQARVIMTGVPLPATAWLLAPAILAAGRFSRRRKAA
jgi:hypothetical protein